MSAARSTPAVWRRTSTGVSVSGGSTSEVVQITTSPWPSVNSGASHGRSSRPETTTVSGSSESPSSRRRARFAGSPTTRP